MVEEVLLDFALVEDKSSSLKQMRSLRGQQKSASDLPSNDE